MNPGIHCGPGMKYGPAYGTTGGRTGDRMTIEGLGGAMRTICCASPSTACMTASAQRTENRNLMAFIRFSLKIIVTQCRGLHGKFGCAKSINRICRLPYEGKHLDSG